MDAESLRGELVAKLRKDGSLTDPAVAAAMETVPRHVFVPEVPVERAYADMALVTKQNADGLPTSSASQPAIVAIMLEQLALAPGMRVLEIGAGTGYNAALLAHLAGASELVTTVDIAADVVERARRGLDAAGYAAVRVLCGDGGLGAPNGAPYDRIIATVGAWDIPPDWISQLAPDGILVLPLGIRGVQRSVAFVRDGEVLRSRSVVPCGFMAMQGAFAGPARTYTAGDQPRLSVTVDDGRPVELPKIGSESVLRPVPVLATPVELFESVDPWIALREADYCRLYADAPGFRHASGIGLVADGSIAHLEMPDIDDRSDPVDLAVRAYGPSASGLADRLAGSLLAWESAGRPSLSDLRIGVYPAGTPDAELAGRHVVDKHHTRLALTLPW
jgi:protein-L-isoaspartate(D-aspartate) O-methyltransferase